PRVSALDLLLCACVCLDAFFFFSSRRRHTRSKRDWSSDVCSSDLCTPADADNLGVYVPVFVSVSWGAVLAYCIVFLALVAVLVRSEERRVGKECRSGGWAEESEERVGKGGGGVRGR